MAARWQFGFLRYKAWGMAWELERSYALAGHPGTVRLLAYLNQADMGSYQAALDSPVRPPDVQATRAYRDKYGFGLSWDQEIAAPLGVFARLGWSDGRNESWTFADVDRTASGGLSLKGDWWARPEDTVGLGGVLNAISAVRREYFAAGGTGILAGDGALNYGFEKSLEVYYDWRVWKQLHATLDYQFVVDPAYNRDRGPVSIFALRLHWKL